jgi:hypothetical protein
MLSLVNHSPESTGCARPSHHCLLCRICLSGPSAADKQLLRHWHIECWLDNDIQMPAPCSQNGNHTVALSDSIILPVAVRASAATVSDWRSIAFHRWQAARQMVSHSSLHSPSANHKIPKGLLVVARELPAPPGYPVEATGKRRAQPGHF